MNVTPLAPARQAALRRACLDFAAARIEGQGQPAVEEIAGVITRLGVYSGTLQASAALQAEAATEQVRSNTFTKDVNKL